MYELENKTEEKIMVITEYVLRGGASIPERVYVKPGEAVEIKDHRLALVALKKGLSGDVPEVLEEKPTKKKEEQPKVGPATIIDSDGSEANPGKEDYSKYTLSELKDLLDDRGIDYTSQDKKNDLIKKLEELDKELEV